MKTTKKATLAVVLTLVIAASSAMAAAGEGGFGGRGGRGGRGGFAGAGLGMGRRAGQFGSRQMGPMTGRMQAARGQFPGMQMQARGGRPGAQAGQRPGPGMGMGRAVAGLPILRMLGALELTEDQQVLIDAIIEEHKELTKVAAQEVLKLTRELNLAVQNGTDSASIRQIAASLGAAIGEQTVIKAETLAGLKSVLTVEQYEQLQDIKAKMQTRTGQMANRGQGRRSQAQRMNLPKVVEE